MHALSSFISIALSGCLTRAQLSLIQIRPVTAKTGNCESCLYSLFVAHHMVMIGPHKKLKKVNFEIYIADRKATTCI